MAQLQPIPGAPAAVATLAASTADSEYAGQRALVIADYHAGIEVGLRSDGIELESNAERRREHVLELLESSGANRLVILGDLAHDIGAPRAEERTELEALVDCVTVPVTLIKGNHDGGIEDVLDIEVTDGSGTRMGGVGFAHGHTWPSPAVLEADVVCIGHEHPTVRLLDDVGGSRVERAWLRGDLVGDAFVAHSGVETAVNVELVVVPAFNDRCSGTWINVPEQEFLAPFLPDALPAGEAFLLDGTRLGDYREL